MTDPILCTLSTPENISKLIANRRFLYSSICLFRFSVVHSAQQNCDWPVSFDSASSSFIITLISQTNQCWSAVDAWGISAILNNVQCYSGRPLPIFRAGFGMRVTFGWLVFMPLLLVYTLKFRSVFDTVDNPSSRWYLCFWSALSCRSVLYDNTTSVSL